MAKDFIYVLYDKNDDGAITLIEAHSSADSAKGAIKAQKMSGSSNVEMKKLDLKSDSKPAATKKGTAKAASKSKADDDDDEDEDGAGDDEAPKSKKKAAPKAEGAKSTRTNIPDGKPNVLKGLKVLFTGTMSMTRETSKATAEKYGAKVITKLEDTDYVILGTQPGPKKLETIEEHDLDTITEDEFFEILQNGVPQEKRDRIAQKAAESEASEPAKKKQKK